LEKGFHEEKISGAKRSFHRNVQKIQVVGEKRVRSAKRRGSGKKKRGGEILGEEILNPTWSNAP